MSYSDYNFDDFNIEDKFNYKMKKFDFIIVDAKIAYFEKQKREIPVLEYVLTNGFSDNVYLDENVQLDCTREMLSLLQFSFNYSLETDLKNLEELVKKHIKLVIDAVENEDFEYLKKIVEHHFDSQRIRVMQFCDNNNKEMEYKRGCIKTLDDIAKVLNCYGKHYDQIKYTYI